MSWKIDLPTLLLVYNTSLGAGALSIFHIHRHSRKPDGLLLMAMAYVLLAVGSALAWRGEIAQLPIWMWTHGSLLMGTVGYSLLWTGVRKFSGRRRMSRTIVLLPVGWFLLGIISGFPSDNLLRAGAFHATAAAVMGACTFELLRDGRAEPLPSRLVMAAFFGLSGSVYALRLAYIVSGEAGSSGFAIAFYIQMFCNFGAALTIATMSSERSERRLEQAAQTDPLTGVGNRRWLMSQLPNFPPAESAIAALDLDKFKQVNDRFGHAVGDEVLVSFAKCLLDILRGSDLIARMGGEEFVIYLRSVSRSEATTIAQRICEQVAKLQVEHEGVRVPVTVSIGIVWIKHATIDRETLLNLADEALYDAKRAGRNRVVIAETAAEIPDDFASYTPVLRRSLQSDAA